MRKTGRTLVLAATAAVAAGMTAPALAATARPDPVSRSATLSRIFAGQHTMIDLVAGQQLGHHVADFVLHHLRSAPAGAR